jgi:uncharacterized membrane protein
MRPQLIAVVIAILIAGMDVARKKGLMRSNPVTGLLISIAVNFLVFWPLAVFLARPELSELQLRTILLFALGGILGTLLARGCNFVGIHRVGPSKNRVVMASRPLIATMLAVLILGEPPMPVVLLGTLLVVMGILAIFLNIQEGNALWRRRDLAFPLAGALFLSSADIVRKEALNAAGSIVGNAINSTAALIGISGFLVFSGPQGKVKSDRGGVLFFLFAGLMLNVIIFLLFEALRLGSVSTVVPIISTSPLFTVIFSYLFLRDVERLTPMTVVGTILAVVGIVLISSA